MKKSLLQERAGIEPIEEALPTSDPSKKVFDYLIKSVARCLKGEGVAVKNLSPQDLQIIAIEWLKQTITSGYVEESLPEDIGENRVITSVLKKKKALNIDDYAPSGKDRGPGPWNNWDQE